VTELLIPGPAGPPAPAGQKMTPQDLERLLALAAVLRKRKPTPEEQHELQQILARSPGLWRKICDLSAIAADGVISSISGIRPLAAEALKRGRLELQQDLGYDAAPPLEKLLIESVVLNWLRYTDAECRHAAVLRQEHLSPAQAHWSEQSVAAAQHRYLRACEALARIRHLVRPLAVQLNIGAQQLRFAQVPDPASGPTLLATPIPMLSLPG